MAKNTPPGAVIVQRMREVVQAVNQVRRAVPRQHENRIGKLENDVTEVKQEQTCCSSAGGTDVGTIDANQGRGGGSGSTATGVVNDLDGREVRLLCDVCADSEGHVTMKRYVHIFFYDGKLGNIKSECEEVGQCV